uniref:Uncharacterized protein n=1 Tax=Megaselia scalaris TaxID=36166 RepID=T1GAS3_MEGSC
MFSSPQTQNQSSNMGITRRISSLFTNTVALLTIVNKKWGGSANVCTNISQAIESCIKFTVLNANTSKSIENFHQISYRVVLKIKKNSFTQTSPLILFLRVLCTGASSVKSKNPSILNIVLPNVYENISYLNGPLKSGSPSKIMRKIEAVWYNKRFQGVLEISAPIFAKIT